MKQVIGVILIGYFFRVEAKNLEDLSEVLKPLFACEEVVVKENSFIKNYKSELWPLISDDCAEQLEVVESACGMKPNQNADACSDVINYELDQHFKAISNKKIQDD